jgi:glycosyltransferase involved in cell wall biosynthesis
MKRVNILILTCSLNIGGAEKHIYDLACNLSRTKIKPVIVCLYELGAIGEMLSGKQGMKVYSNVMRSKVDIFMIRKLASIIKNEDIDIMYILHSPLALFWGTLCAKLAGVGAILTRFTSTYQTLRVKRRKIVNYLMLRYVDTIIAQASSHKEYLSSHENINSERIVVINNGVDMEQFSNPVDDVKIRKRIGLPLHAPVIGIVANLRPEKGHSVFLKAARKILDLFPDAHFLIVGDGSEREHLEKISKNLLIREKVHFLGVIRNVAEIIPVFDIAVISSSSTVETFSNAILEYMASSKPVIATNVGSLAEQVVDGETGCLIAYDDPTALAEAILKLLADMNTAKRMGEAGRRMVKENFTVQKMIAKYESVFADLLN